MSILFLILKIIGIILLVLAIVVAVILIWPFRYRVLAQKQEEFTLDAEVSWLCGLLRILIDKKEEWRVRILLFGRELGKRSKTPKEEPAPDGEESKELTIAEAPPAADTPSPARKRPDPFRPAPEKQAKNAGEVRRVALEDIPQEAPPVQKLDLDYFLHLPWEEKKGLLGIALTVLKKLFRHIRPRKYRIEGVVGTKDPATTGYILGACGALKALWGENLQVRADFQREVLEGEVFLQGRIQLGSLLGIGIWCLTKAPIRKLIKIYLKGKGGKHGRKPE